MPIRYAGRHRAAFTRISLGACVDPFRSLFGLKFKGISGSPLWTNASTQRCRRSNPSHRRLAAESRRLRVPRSLVLVGPRSSWLPEFQV